MLEHGHSWSPALFDPARHALAWRLHPREGDIVLANAVGNVTGAVVARNLDGTPASLPITDATCVRWVPHADEGDTVLGALPCAMTGSIVFSPVCVMDATLYVHTCGIVPPCHTRETIRRCIAEDGRLRAHYTSGADGRICTRSDGAPFATVSDALAHMLDATGVDVLDWLRHRPATTFPNTYRWVQTVTPSVA